MAARCYLQLAVEVMAVDKGAGALGVKVDWVVLGREAGGGAVARVELGVVVARVVGRCCCRRML
jgi:hypothetical protein